MSKKKARARSKNNGHDTSKCHLYYLSILPDFKVGRRLRTYDPPNLCNTLDGIWFAIGKKKWEGYRVGDMMRIEDVPSRVIETLKRKIL